MEIEENVKKFLEEEEERNLWKEIFDAFQREGKEGIKTLLKKKEQEIKDEFEQVKKSLIGR